MDSQFNYATKHIFTSIGIYAERFFSYGDSCPGQFVVALRMMISDMLAPSTFARQNQVNALLSFTFSLQTVSPNPRNFRICEGCHDRRPRHTSRSCKT